MEAEKRQLEYTAELEGPAPFMDVVFEVVEAHVGRTRHAYAEVITGVEAEDAGDVDNEQHAVLLLYILPEVAPQEAREYIGRALDQIADDQNMSMARGRVQLRFLDRSEEEEE